MAIVSVTRLSSAIVRNARMGRIVFASLALCQFISQEPTAWENGRLPGKPIIALDATYGVEHPRHPLTGVGVYSRRILQGLATQHPEAGFRWCYRTHRFWRGAKETRPANTSASPLFERWIPSCNLFHGLNQRMPAQRAARSVCTFHDLFVMSSDDYSWRSLESASRIRRARRFSDAIW